MKKIRLNKKVIILVSIITALIILGIVIAIILANPKGKSSNKKENNTQKEEVKVEEVKIIDVNSNSRPYAIMINCHNGALPQAGLQNAYIVYEIMVEGGITRMMALFKDADVSKIGSIRSARTQFLDYVYENDAIYFHAGGASDAVSRMGNEGINNISVDGAYGMRDTSLDRNWEHTLFTSTDLMQQAISDRGFKTTTEAGNLLTYQAKSINYDDYSDKIEAKNISITYSYYRTSNYKYDSSKKVYLRSMNDTSNVDLVTGNQYEVKNIIVYGVEYSSYTHNGYSLYQKIDNVGSGEGYYITEGYAIPITWEKSSKNSKTIYKYKQTGKELVVNDGNTYIQIYPINENLTIN